MKNKPNLLVVCGRNKKRSRTAEFIFKNDDRFNIRSVGLSPKSERKITDKDVIWSDLIFVMEDSQQARIVQEFRNLQLPHIEVLDIPDEFEFMDPELILILTERLNLTLQTIYKF